MTEWLVNVIVVPVYGSELAEEQLMDAFADVGDLPGALLVDGRHLEIGVIVEAASAMEAAATAGHRVEERLPELFGGGEVVGVQASTAGEVERDLERGGIHELIDDETAEQRLAGLAETAELLRVTRPRVAVLRKRPDFPRPVAELASGPVWVAGEIEAFVQRWNRQPGRRADMPQAYRQTST